MELILQIVNASTNIPTSDPNTANLVYATWAIAIATIIGITITASLTKKSLNLTKTELIETRKSNILIEKELKTRLRPQLEFVKTKSSL